MYVSQQKTVWHKHIRSVHKPILPAEVSKLVWNPPFGVWSTLPRNTTGWARISDTGSMSQGTHVKLTMLSHGQVHIIDLFDTLICQSKLLSNLPIHFHLKFETINCNYVMVLNGKDNNTVDRLFCDHLKCRPTCGGKQEVCAK